MAHLAASAINAWLSSQGKVSPTLPVLDSAQRAIISSALISDARGLFYSAVVTVIDAINGISSGYFSWSVVKLYYASFYSARVLLAANDVALFYPANGKPYSLLLRAGECAKKEKGVTHKVVWDVLERQLPSSPLLGSVGLQSASRWLMGLREEANYRNPRFLEPAVPSYFAALDRIGIEDAIKVYTADTSYLYSFDPDHAALAFPLECLRSAGVALRRSSGTLDESDVEHVRGCLGSVGVDPDSFLSIC